MAGLEGRGLGGVRVIKRVLSCPAFGPLLSGKRLRIRKEGAGAVRTPV